MNWKTLIVATFTYFAITPAISSFAASGLITTDTPVWTTTDTATTLSTVSSPSTVSAVSTVAPVSSGLISSSLMQPATLSAPTPIYQSARYGYDELDRLKWVEYADGTIISYDYDKVGNRTTKTTSTATLPSFTITSLATGSGSIIPSGSTTIYSGNGQTFFIEQGIVPNGTGCISGYIFVSTNNRCEKLPTVCSVGYTFNPSTNQCEQTLVNYYQATCTAGALNVNNGQCEYAASVTPGVQVTFSTKIYQQAGTFGYLTFSRPWSSNCSGPYTPTSAVAFGYCSPTFFPGSIGIALSADIPPGGQFCWRAVSNTITGNCYINSTNQPSWATAQVYSNGNWASGVSGTSIMGYASPSNINLTTPTLYSCPNGGELTETTCQLTPVCASGGTLSGTTCTITTLNISSPTCSDGTLDPINRVCYLFQPGSLSNLLVDNVAVGLSTLPRMQTPTGEKFYYTFNNIAADHAITATFSDATQLACSQYPAKIIGSSSGNYLSLLAAYNAAATGDTIQTNMYHTPDNLLLDRNVGIVLDGGYSCDFSSKNGSLKINSGLTINAGSLTLLGSIIIGGI